jgi:hypothetical protein
MTRNPRALLQAIGIIATVVLVAGYTYFETRGLILGPVVTVTSPAPGSTVTNEVIALIGTTRRASDITLNDRPIFVDKNGGWSEVLILAPGQNVLELTVTDRFGRVQRELVELVYKPTDLPAQAGTLPSATTTTENTSATTAPISDH